jgi:hypothetical protein
MEDFENLNTEVGADQGEVADSQEGAESQEGEQKEPGGAGRGQEAQEEKRPGTHEENAAMKAARIRGQKDAEAALRKEYDERVAAIGMINPETGKPFAAFAEFARYGKKVAEERIEAKAKKEGRSVDEVREEEEAKVLLAQKKEADKARERDEEEKKKQSEFLKADAKRFREEFPKVDVAKLETNPKFQRFAKGRLYREPLAEIYTDYLDFVTDAEKTALEKADSKKARSTGAGGGDAKGTLTTAQQKALEDWNRLYPRMKMTAAEFKERDG